MKLSGEAEPRLFRRSRKRLDMVAFGSVSIPLTSILSHPGEEADQDASPYFGKEAREVRP